MQKQNIYIYTYTRVKKDGSACPLKSKNTCAIYSIPTLPGHWQGFRSRERKNPVITKYILRWHLRHLLCLASFPSNKYWIDGASVNSEPCNWVWEWEYSKYCESPRDPITVEISNTNIYEAIQKKAIQILHSNRYHFRHLLDLYISDTFQNPRHRKPIRWREKMGNCHLCDLQGVLVWHFSRPKSAAGHGYVTVPSIPFLGNFTSRCAIYSPPPGGGTWAIYLFWRRSICMNKKQHRPAMVYLGVSKNRGTPKSSILIGFSIINHPFWGTPIYGNIFWLKHLHETTAFLQRRGTGMKYDMKGKGATHTVERALCRRKKWRSDTSQPKNNTPTRGVLTIMWNI